MTGGAEAAGGSQPIHDRRRMAGIAALVRDLHCAMCGFGLSKRVAARAPPPGRMMILMTILAHHFCRRWRECHRRGVAIEARLGGMTVVTKVDGPWPGRLSRNRDRHGGALRCSVLIRAMTRGAFRWCRLLVMASITAGGPLDSELPVFSARAVAGQAAEFLVPAVRKAVATSGGRGQLGRR
jgi:hypothetical protein